LIGTIVQRFTANRTADVKEMPHKLWGADEPKTLWARNGLRPPLAIELGENVLHVRFDRLRRDGQGPRDLFVGTTLGDQDEDLVWSKKPKNGQRTRG
jgi:hypothetical protein